MTQGTSKKPDAKLNLAGNYTDYQVVVNAKKHSGYLVKHLSRIYSIDDLAKITGAQSRAILKRIGSGNCNTFNELTAPKHKPVDVAKRAHAKSRAKYLKKLGAEHEQPEQKRAIFNRLKNLPTRAQLTGGAV